MSNRWYQNQDLIALSLATLLILVVVIAFPNWHSPLRIALGFIFLLLLPGYALAAFLFPDRKDVDGLERLALSLGLSVVTIPFLGLLLNYTPWGIHPVPMMVALSLFVSASILVTLYRRQRLRARQPDFTPLVTTGELRFNLGWLGLVMLFSAGVVVTAFVLRPDKTPTEFYILGPDGQLEDYPMSLSPGERFNLTLSVHNGEGVATAFEVRLPFETQRRVLQVPSLEDSETWEQVVELQAPPGEGQTKLALELYLAGSATPYRTLHLFVTLSPSTTNLAN